MERRSAGRSPPLLLALVCGALAQAPELPTAADYVRNSPVDLAYSNNPTLARSTETTTWLNRDKLRVVTSVTHTLANKVATALVGSADEILDQARLTRHGLYRRVDAKFAQFVPRTVDQDGYGLWRNWESQGNCPPELLIRDPWGTIAWEATYGAHVKSTECSWVVQPGMFRKDGYIRLSRAPVVLSFRTLSLLAGIEYLDVYDGAHTEARMLARYTGRKVPQQITSSGAELRIVYWVDLNRTASQGWEEIEAALIEGKMVAAVRRFATMARFGVSGFYNQNARRALETIAARLSSKPQNHWMRRKWFRSTDDFERAYNTATATVGQDADLWQKRHRHEPGKEGMPWETALGSRRWPQAFVEPEQNPNYHVMASGNGLDFTPTTEGVWQHDEPSGFSVDFTTTADCRGAGLATEGKGVMPPLSVSGDPHRNYIYLPFPLPASSCQLMEIDGPQTTAARPFTIVESLMKTAAEEEMTYCVDGSCSPVMSGISGGGGNCSDSCEVFLACTANALVNRSEWRIGRNLYNKSLVMRARDRCLDLPEAIECLNIKQPDINLGESPISLDNPKSAGCLDLDCFFCGQVLWSKYFTCAIDCGQNMTHPSTKCSDCSYNFDNMYEEIDKLRYKLWEAYFVGAMGKTGCSEILCSPMDVSLMSASEPMSEDCRRCHYPIEDFINTDHEACLHGDLIRCVSLIRGINNYMQDVFAPDLFAVGSGQQSNATTTEVGTADGTAGETADGTADGTAGGTVAETAVGTEVAAGGEGSATAS